MSEVRVYDPKKTVIIVGGFPMSGYADGTFATIESVADDVSSQSGADGEIAIALSNDMRNRLTLTLQQTSASNDILDKLRKAFRLSGGAALIPVLFEDLTGRTVFAAAQGWIVRRPSLGFGKDVGTREWVIEMGEASIDVVGGNG